MKVYMLMMKVKILIIRIELGIKMKLNNLQIKFSKVELLDAMANI